MFRLKASEGQFERSHPLHTPLLNAIPIVHFAYRKQASKEEEFQKEKKKGKERLQLLCSEIGSLCNKKKMYLVQERPGLLLSQ